MLNIAGPEYDFGTVVYAVLQDCEHRRRAFDDDEFESSVTTCAKQKLAQIKKAYDEFGGSAVYWDALEKEVLHAVVPQYIDPALEVTQLERNGFSVWRKGDLAARLAFALIGLIIGSLIVAIPWIPIFENIFAFALTIGGFMYPDLKRFMYERRYAKALNKLIADSAAYQQTANLHYMTATDIETSFQPSEPRKIDTTP
jgi:hypothetical protein